MNHDINLNIHYTIPNSEWDKVIEVFKSMPNWFENKWLGECIDLWYSVEPSGVQIAGTMPDSLWIEWYAQLKERLTKTLKYEIGEPEDGYKFKYWD